MTNEKTIRRVRRTVTGILSAACLFAGGFAATAPATAAPTCSAGYVCFWTGKDGTGEKKSYSAQANHTHRTASVYYNYNKLPVSFWTGPSGMGEVITHYKLSQRGFRNWSSSNWERCRSHRDYY